MSDNIIDRDELQDAYIERIIDGMDHKCLWQYVYDSLEQNFEKYTVDELIGEVEEYYPDLLDSWGSGTQGVVLPPISCIVYTSQTTNDSHA